jgi:hypothetical protein
MQVALSAEDEAFRDEGPDLTCGRPDARPEARRSPGDKRLHGRDLQSGLAVNSLQEEVGRSVLARPVRGTGWS